VNPPVLFQLQPGKFGIDPRFVSSNPHFDKVRRWHFAGGKHRVERDPVCLI